MCKNSMGCAFIQKGVKLVKSNLIKILLMSLGLSIGSVFGVGFFANASYCLDKHSKMPKEPTFLVDAAGCKN